MEPLTKVWVSDVTGVVCMLRFLNDYIDEDDEDVDEEEFYDDHIEEYVGVTVQTILNLVKEWFIGHCTIKTIVEFLDNFVESDMFWSRMKKVGKVMRKVMRKVT